MAKAEAQTRWLGRLGTAFQGLGGGAPLFPLMVLFGLNAVDELDRGAFGVLLPEIRKAFGLNLTGVTALSAAVIPAALLIGFPIARIADRKFRLPLVIGGAAMWGLFSVFTGLAPTIFYLGLARVGAGIGRAVNDPVHSSLLSDYYPPESRTKVFGFHRAANTVGAFFGPLIAGFLADSIGWRTPFIILSIPTFVFVLLAMRLREPERSGLRTTESDVRTKEAFRILWSVGTLKRLWLAFPFISFFVIALGQIMSLYYHDIFHASAGLRGVIQAADAPFIILGLAIGTPLVDRGMRKDPGRVMRIIGLAVVCVAVFIIGIAVAPSLWIAVVFTWSINVLGTVLYAGGFSIISLAAPPEVRASAFAFFNISALLGVTALPILGVVGDQIGLRWGLAALVPFVLTGSAILASAGRFVNADIDRVTPSHIADETMPPPQILEPGAN